MKKQIALILAGALLLAGCIYLYRLEVSETRTYPARAIGAIKALTQNGAIEVTSAAETVVTAKITRTCMGTDRADAERALEDVTVGDELFGGRLTLTSHMPALNPRSCGAAYALAAPDSVALDLSTSNGKIALAGMTGGATLSTSNGEVTLNSTRGAVKLHTSNGAVRATNHRGSLDAQTSNGEMVCDFASFDPGGPIHQVLPTSLQTSNGKITVRLPSDVSCVFDASTSNGSITVTGFSVNYSLNDRGHKRGTIGSGAESLTIVTSNGDIVIGTR